MNAIRNNGTTDGKWQASAIIDNGHIWDAMPGSYYKWEETGVKAALMIT